MLASGLHISYAFSTTALIMCYILATTQYSFSQVTCRHDELNVILPVRHDSIITIIDDSLFCRNQVHISNQNSSIIKKIRIRPSGYINVSGLFYNDAYPISQAIINWNARVSQTLFGIPLTLNGAVTSFDFSGNKTNGSYAVSFDRDLFLARLREELVLAQQRKYEGIFDSLKKMETILHSYDSIRSLLNNEVYLGKVVASQHLLESALKLNSDSAITDLFSTQTDTSLIHEAEKDLAKYEELQREYDLLLQYRTKILAQYSTLDLHEITSRFSLPVSPSQLNEDQLLDEAKDQGLSYLNKWLSGLKQLSFGETILNQSPLTLSEKIANGFSFSYSMKGVFFGAALARERLNPIPYSGSGNQYIILSGKLTKPGVSSNSSYLMR